MPSGAPGIFRSEVGGTIRVDLRSHPNGAMLTIADNGIGMSSGHSDEAAGDKGLGMRLVKALVGQLGARMTVDSPLTSSKDHLDPSGGAGGTRVTRTSGTLVCR